MHNFVNVDTINRSEGIANLQSIHPLNNISLRVLLRRMQLKLVSNLSCE